MTLRHEPNTSMIRGNYVFVDGPSIDRCLGEVIGRAPTPDTRPDWRSLAHFVNNQFGPAMPDAYQPTFVVWGPGQEGFLHFLRMSGFKVGIGERFTSGKTCVDVIRQGIAELNQPGGARQPWNLIVGTQNQSFIRELPNIATGAERIGVFGFSEELPSDHELERLIEFYDIEDDANLFRTPLDRSEYEESPEEAPPAPPSYDYQPALASAPAVEQPTSPPPHQAPPTNAERDLFLIVDGRSIDKELGEILGEKPNPETRPDWGKVLSFTRNHLQAGNRDVNALFAHIAPGHSGFKYALKDLGYASKPVNPDETQPLRPVVEEYVAGLLAARLLRGETGKPAPDVIVVGHSQAIFDALSSIPNYGQQLCVLGFPERMPAAEYYPQIVRLDIENDAQAFGSPLPREFGVNVDDFDPDDELSRLF